MEMEERMQRLHQLAGSSSRRVIATKKRIATKIEWYGGDKMGAVTHQEGLPGEILDASCGGPKAP